MKLSPDDVKQILRRERAELAEQVDKLLEDRKQMESSSKDRASQSWNRGINSLRPKLRALILGESGAAHKPPDEVK